ncbi:T9SS type A sorting domain-containing protein [Cryomorpha ignava]|uniref:T9SS type A sorting domain-containing protein n=1 Tax=Cryomorpha ignava TaxID=101383 RepID=A0A7K3WWB3_9FLAO|nr:T9SS type A sorting domain-containing protein [Cryomorpha ignava]NEN24895.1 T9SS type A sorting domain-containing protein [Cryomorpha ignava]
MKIKSATLIVTMLLLASIAHAQFLTWETLNTGTTKTINDIHFLDADTGYMVGNDYLFKKTVDGGTTWQDLQVPTIGQAEDGNGDLVAVNRQVGADFGQLESGIILVWKQPLFTVLTADDGESYSENFGTGTPICDAKGLNITPQFDGNGYIKHTVFGKSCSSGGAYTYFLDGPFAFGMSEEDYFGNGEGYTSMDVNPNTNRFVLGHEDGNLLININVLNEPDTVFLDTTGVGAVAYAGNNVWYAATSDLYYSMYKSLDDGLTFEVDPTWIPTFFYPHFRAMEFLENGLGLAGAQSNEIYGAIFVQNGSEWSYYNADKPINTVTILPNGTAFAAGENGLLMRSNEPITVGVKEIELNNSIDIYPNPANSIVQLSNAGNSIIMEITVLDNSGRVIKSYPAGTTTLDLSSFDPSLYFVWISTDKGAVVKKVVVF